MNRLNYTPMGQQESQDNYKHPTKKRAPKSMRKKKRKAQKIARRLKRQ